MEYRANQIVVVRPYSNVLFEVPAIVLAVDPGGYRCDVQYAAGNTENVGVGNIRPAAGWQAASYARMTTDRLLRLPVATGRSLHA